MTALPDTKPWYGVTQKQAYERGLSDAHASLAKAVTFYDSLMATVTGCSDGGCMIRAPQGMHTNGGCRCHRDSMKTQRVLYAAKQLREAIAAAPTTEETNHG